MTADDRPPPRTPSDGRISKERWTHIERIFAEAVDLAPSERDPFLDEACGDDVGLRHEVESLLAADEGGTGFIDRPPHPEAPPAPADDPPTTIGPYSIIRALGRGGMGQVWLAERQAPGFRQRVALKLLRRGLDTDDLIARFRAERQILAGLNHPNIARLLDVGATDDGLPYFAMEYVDGVPILDHCDAQRLSVEERLRLVVEICDAVQHAHGALVVHRDLKPANILATSDGSVKLLDFGIAKVLHGGDDDADRGLTRADTRLITPRYAAPEQIRGEPITTACDVFALGVLMYELLVGCHPQDRAHVQGHDAVKDTPSAAEPTPPSATLNDEHAARVGAARSTSPAQLRRALRGDLDTVVLKALREEPGERYASALSLAEDIERHLTGLPVKARPPSLEYRARKFITRHRLPVAAAAVFVVGLTTSTGFALHQSRLASERATLVAQERDKAFEVRSFLLEMFGTTGPDQATGDSVTARQLLDRRATVVVESYPDDPETRAEMLTVLAEGYERLGLYDDARAMASEGLTIRAEVLGPVHPDLAVSLNVLGWLERQRGDLSEAERLLRESVAMGQELFGARGDPRLARALNDLGVVQTGLGDYDDAERALRASLEMRRNLLGDDHLGVAITTSNLGVVLAQEGRLDDATVLLDSARVRFERSVGPEHQRTLTTLFNLASLRSLAGDHAASVSLHRELLQRRERLLGPTHPDVAESMVSLANEMRAVPALDEAVVLLGRALAIQAEALGDRHPDIGYTLRVRGHVLASAGRHADAVADFEHAAATLRETGSERSQGMAEIRYLEAQSREALGSYPAAEHAWREAARVVEGVYGSGHPESVRYRLALVSYLLRRGDEAAADAELRPAEQVLSAHPGDMEALREAARALRAELPPSA